LGKFFYFVDGARKSLPDERLLVLSEINNQRNSQELIKMSESAAKKKKKTIFYLQKFFFVGEGDERKIRR